MKFIVITLFPEYFESPLRAALLGKAIEAGTVEVELVDLRAFGEGRHRITDDYPFGGGAGMVMKPGPVIRAIESVREREPECRVLLLTPQGQPFRQTVAQGLALAAKTVAIVCGRYEGFDERIRGYCDGELSIGDYVLMGGEAAALAVVDATARLVPGVLGAAESSEEESLSQDLLEYPQYTRPRDFRGAAVPEVLVSGNHGEIRQWRRRQAILRTARRRPDLIRIAQLSPEERAWLEGELRRDGLAA